MHEHEETSRITIIRHCLMKCMKHFSRTDGEHHIVHTSTQQLTQPIASDRQIYIALYGSHYPRLAANTTCGPGGIAHMQGTCIFSLVFIEACMTTWAKRQH